MSPRLPLLPLLVLFLAACGDEPEGTGPTLDGTLFAEDYTLLTAGTSWIYRDDGGGDVPDEQTLLRAQAVEAGRVSLRRGQRWADAAEAGSLEWDIDGGGLRLLAWDLPDRTQGSGPDLPVLTAEVEDGDVVAGAGGWSCAITATAAGVGTYYGEFEDVLLADCAGGDGLAGTYAFARDIGLVRLETGDYTLDLVAPW